MFALSQFEQQLVMYVASDDKSVFETPFDISKIPVVTREQADAEDRTKKLTATTPSLKPPKAGPTKAATSAAEAAASASAAAQKYAEEIMQVPEIREFGSILKSCPMVELTEAETEYVVGVVKHIFKEHIVLQYEIKNTLPATVLENVSVVATPSDEEELEEVFIVQAEKLETDVPGKVYVAFRKVNGSGSLPVSTFSNVLRFTSKEIDPATNEPEEGGYEDEYEVSDFDLSGSDYVVPIFASNFAHVWEQVGAQGEEAEETLQLSGVKNIAGTSGTVVDADGGMRANHASRGDRAIGQGDVTPGLGRDRHTSQPDNPHAEAAGEDSQRRKGSGKRTDGLLVQDGSHDQDHGEKRGGGCGGSCCRVRRLTDMGCTQGVICSSLLTQPTPSVSGCAGVWGRPLCCDTDRVVLLFEDVTGRPRAPVSEKPWYPGLEPGIWLGFLDTSKVLLLNRFLSSQPPLARGEGSCVCVGERAQALCVIDKLEVDWLIEFKWILCPDNTEAARSPGSGDCGGAADWQVCRTGDGPGASAASAVGCLNVTGGTGAA